MTTHYLTEADKLRNYLDGLDTIEEKRHTALLALMGPIRDTLKNTMTEIEVLFQVLDAEWDWERV